MFVDKGQEVVSTKGKISQWDRVHKAINEPVDTEIPLVVLIDERRMWLLFAMLALEYQSLEEGNGICWYA